MRKFALILSAIALAGCGQGSSKNAYGFKENDKVVLADDAYGCLYPQTLALAATYFESNDQKNFSNVVSSGACFASAKIRHGLKWTVVEIRGSAMEIKAAPDTPQDCSDTDPELSKYCLQLIGPRVYWTKAAFGTKSP